MLQALPPGAAADTASVAGQANSVGTVIKANGDVDPLGVVSVLPLDLHREQACVQQVRARCAVANSQQVA